MPSSNESRQNSPRGIGDKPVLSLVEGTCWTYPLSGNLLLAMGIVKEKDDVYGRCGKKKGRQCPRSQGSSVSSFACILRLEDLIIRLISMPIIRIKLESMGLR